MFKPIIFMSSNYTKMIAFAFLRSPIKEDIKLSYCPFIAGNLHCAQNSEDYFDPFKS